MPNKQPYLNAPRLNRRRLAIGSRAQDARVNREARAADGPNASTTIFIIGKDAPQQAVTPSNTAHHFDRSYVNRRSFTCFRIAWLCGIAARHCQLRKRYYEPAATNSASNYSSVGLSLTG